MFDEEKKCGEVALVRVGDVGLAHVGNSRDAAAEWREIDAALKRVAKARGRLDGEELLWLARADRAEIHRVFGHATILEYVERVLGYGPRVARERLRVARALETLPRLRAELAEGRLSYSAVREVSRVAKPWNEERWIQRVEGMCLREVEETLAGHQEGDDPDDKTRPDLALRQITFELTTRTLALFRDAARQLEDEVGHPMTDDEVIATLCASALRDVVIDEGVIDEGGASEGGASEDDGRAHVGTNGSQPRNTAPQPYQVAFTICRECKRGTHDAAGRSFDVPVSTVEQALCYAQFVGCVDLDVPVRAARNIPAAIARLVWRRDGGRCVVPGCRSTRHIEVHHINFRRNGGDHSPGNLACLCWAHHAALHEGKLLISGRAPDRLVFERIDPLLAAIVGG
jgi:hypothetical protein